MTCLPPLVQPPSLHRHALDHRLLFRKISFWRLPLASLQPRPPSKNRTDLPLDAIPHSFLFLLGPNGLPPLLLSPTISFMKHPPHPSEGPPTLSSSRSAALS